MKILLKLREYCCYIVMILIFIAGSFFVVEYYNPDESVSEKKSSIYNSFNVSSHSMEPTFIVGERYRIEITNEIPKVGDVVEFYCIKGDCGISGTNNSNATIHRLTAISPTGCMTIVGDNPKYDWSKVPCYMPDDIRITGVVHKLP